MCLWEIYIFPRSVSLFFWRKYVDRSWDYINRSHINVEIGAEAALFPEKEYVHKGDFRCSATTSTNFQFTSLSMLNLRHPLFTWHIANKCRIPVTCHVTLLHHPGHLSYYKCTSNSCHLSCYTFCIAVSAIFHALNTLQIPVTLLCYISCVVTCRNPTQACQFL